LSTINQAYGSETAIRPSVRGHEIVGIVERAGAKAAHQLGDRVAVGTMQDSCGACEQCAQGDECYCAHGVFTCSGVHKATGTRCHGGFAERMIVDGRWAFKLPDALPSTEAASLMCAGITVFQPLKRHFRPNATVGVASIGGLGHLALQFARALGYKTVVALTSTAGKADEARSLGAHDVVVLSDKDALKAAAKTLDVLLVTAAYEQPWTEYARLMRVGGMMCLVGLPAKGKVELPGFLFLLQRLEFSGSVVGGRAMTAEMLRVAAQHGVRAVAETLPLSAEGVNEALRRIASNTVRFRSVLVPAETAPPASPPAV